jgi:peptide/nickel transport system ATP-binding protein
VNRSYGTKAALFTSPRERGEVGSPLAIRVRGTIRESEIAVSPPHPDPLPASGERENRKLSLIT